MPSVTDHELNPRVAAMQPSATLAMSARAKALVRAGKPVIELSAGEPDFDTPAPICEAGRRAIDEGHTRYTANAGTPALREAIVRKLRDDNGLDYTPAEILCSNGAKQSVAQAIFVLCRPGDEVVIPAPYWVSYPEMVRLAGAESVVVETAPERGYRMGPDELEAALTERTRIVVLNSPSNPTGAVYSRDELEALAEVLRGRDDVFVVSDEIYEHVIYDAEHVSFAALDGMRERTVTVNGFSKAYAMTGWRLGYLAAPAWIVEAASTMQGQFTSAPSAITQQAGPRRARDGPRADPADGPRLPRAPRLRPRRAREHPGRAVPDARGRVLRLPRRVGLLRHDGAERPRRRRTARTSASTCSKSTTWRSSPAMRSARPTASASRTPPRPTTSARRCGGSQTGLGALQA